MSSLSTASGAPAVPRARPRDLPGVLREQARGRDCVSAHLRLPGERTGSPGCRGEEAAGARGDADGYLLRGLADGQKELAWSILGFISHAAMDPLLRLQGEDVVDMAESLAATLRTAQRGVIYEHRPRSLVAQRLSTDVKAFLEQRRQAREERGFEQDVAAALEQIATTFRDAARITGVSEPTLCLSAVGRVLREADAAVQAEASAAPVAAPPPGPRLIQP